MTDNTHEFTVPAGSRLELIEASPDHLLIYVPAGGQRSRGIGFFALLWNAITGVVFAGILAAGAKQQDAPLLIPFFGLFWAVGLGMTYWWLRMRFLRMHLLLRRDSLTLQRHLLGRQWMTEALLDEYSSAELIESYKENDNPVYCVAVYGSNRTEKFGTSLSRNEKRWFVATINEFLGVDEPGEQAELSFPAHCSACGAAINPKALTRSGGSHECNYCGVLVEPHAAASASRTPIANAPIEDVDPLSASFEGLEVIQSDATALEFQLPLAPAGRTRRIVSLVVFGFGLCGLLVTGAVLSQFLKHGGFAVVALAMALGPLAVVVPLSLAVRRGRIHVRLDREETSVRWGLGPLGITRVVPTESIRGVTLQSNKMTSSGRQRSADIPVCVVLTDRGRFPLTTWHGQTAASTVAGMLRFQLHRWGHDLSSQPSHSDP